MKGKILLVATVFALTFQSLFGQGTTSVNRTGLPQPKDFDRFSIGLYGGLCAFQGDIREKYTGSNGSKNFEAMGCYGLQFQWQISHSIGLLARGGMANFTQSPSDSIFIPELGTRHKVKFESKFNEGSLNLTYTFGNISFLQRNKNFHMLAFTGVGLMSHKSTLKDVGGQEPRLLPIDNQDVAVTEIYVPFGFGMKYAFGDLNVGFLVDYNIMFTDRVDLVEAGSSYDGYSHATLSLNYTFGSKKNQMEWVNPVELVYNDIAEVKQKVEGLTNDKDKDGVADIFDKDSSTPEGIKVYGDGTSVDTDHDGVTDTKDMDPYSMPNAKVDTSGRELDADKDGVGDLEDREPNTPAGTLVNFQGIALSNAGTNLNSKDLVSSNGGVGFLPSVFFDLAKYNVKTTYNERMLLVARVMKLNPDLKVTLVGSTDQIGKTESNKKLGMARAEAVKKHLMDVYGIDGKRLVTTTVGMDEPFAKPTKATDYLNRRVDFRVDMSSEKKQ